MAKRKKKMSQAEQWYWKMILLLFSIYLFYEAGGWGMVMIVFTLVVAIGAIYLDRKRSKGKSYEVVPLESWIKDSTDRRIKKINRIPKPHNGYRISKESLIKMSPDRFELFVAEVYKRQGYDVSVTKKSGDGGKDIVMRKGGRTYFVECKKFSKDRVSRPTVQKLVGACYPSKAIPIFVTTSEFTKEAREEAYRSGVCLVDGDELIRMIQSVL
ncbi:restriction endonuclease [Turicibacter sp. TS3]|uniref:restriction endonuclease n=1 Tax=Turicibacter sp. TS3 TaxID=2304578 RepID=UPI00137A199E|nr:restriction endonuclease [Turicibacter sp. TS3]NCE78318.1 restriction endonuclease [Turicibacter sp. TS3]